MSSLIKSFKKDVIEIKKELNIPYDIHTQVFTIKPKSKNIENSKYLNDFILFDNPKSEKFNLAIKDEVFKNNFDSYMDKTEEFDYY